MNKPGIRQMIAVKLAQLEDGDRCVRSEKICSEAIRSIEWADVNQVSCYSTQKSLGEVDISKLIDFIQVSYSRINIDFVEPTLEANIPDKQYDLIFVPVVAFDGSGNRLGRGGGWYDRFLAGQSNATKIGVAYLEQHVPDIPVEPHDIRLDQIFSA